MADLRDEVTALIRADKLEGTVDRLLAFLGKRDPELIAELTEHGRTLERSRKQVRRGLLAGTEESLIRTKVAYALLDLLPEILEAPDANAPPTQETTGAKQAFISYSHHDREAAERLAQALRSAGVVVLIDDKAMRAGEGIESFIKDSIAKADVTVSLVSRTSLLSAWVAMETIQAFEHGRFDRGRQFIACYLDDGFFQPGFRLTATQEIDARIGEIDELLPRYAEEKLDPVELNSEKSRLFKLRNNLGEILLRLKEHLTLDLRKESFESSIARLIHAIQVPERERQPEPH